MTRYFFKHEQFFIIPRVGVFIEPVDKFNWISFDLTWLFWTASLNIRFINPFKKQ